MVRAVERNDARLAGREQRGAQRDLDRVLARDTELGRPRQRIPEPLCDFRLRQITECVRDGRLGDRCRDLRIAVTERRDPEAAGQVDVLASLGVPDAAALGFGPDQAPFRRPIKRPSVSAAM